MDLEDKINSLSNTSGKRQLFKKGKKENFKTQNGTSKTIKTLKSITNTHL